MASSTPVTATPHPSTAHGPDDSRIALEASKNPISNDPASPMKIFAGGQLCLRNPSNPPSSVNIIAATNNCG